MASDFIGYTILVTLQHPPSAQIQGIVSDVVNQKLFLRDVLFRWNGQRLPYYTLESSSIADLEIAPASESQLSTPVTATQPTQFVDPAIVSYAKQNSQNLNVTSDGPVSPIVLAEPTKVPGLRGVSSISSIATQQATRPDRKESRSAATLTEPFDALSSEGRKVRVSQTGPGIIDLKDVQNGPLKKKASKGKGWRQGPFLEETNNANAKKQRGRRQVEDANGWATEDATDIQDLGDFDFETNLSKFDKRRVFDDIRKDDKVAESDRLVSFNRIAKPGTNGGRNLHFSENVLDEPDTLDRWKSEAGETEDDVHNGQYSSGKPTKRGSSKHAPMSRKGSMMPIRPESPRPLTRTNTATPLNGSGRETRATFRLENNKPCNCVSPLQMLEIEQLCTAELGLTEDMLSENAGRSIAEAVVKSDVRNILFLVGNHKSGARAIAAARHLRNRRLRVTVCLLGGEREELLLEVVRKQLAVYQKGLGYVERWDDYQSKLAVGGPMPDLVVDALLGLHVAFDELRTDDQAAVYEMVKWVNRGLRVMSIDVPSGLSASSGLAAEVDGQTLMIQSKDIVCLGAPKTGLLSAMSGDEIDSDWNIFVADIGISTAAWQKHGSRRKHGTEFGNDWVVMIKLAPA